MPEWRWSHSLWFNCSTACTLVWSVDLLISYSIRPISEFHIRDILSHLTFPSIGSVLAFLIGTSGAVLILLLKVVAIIPLLGEVSKWLTGLGSFFYSLMSAEESCCCLGDRLFISINVLWCGSGVCVYIAVRITLIIWSLCTLLGFTLTLKILWSLNLRHLAWSSTSVVMGWWWGCSHVICLLVDHLMFRMRTSISCDA